MNVFNLISAGGGSGSGLYIWKKYNTETPTFVNPSFTLNYSSSKHFTITNANFDISILPTVTGISGIKSTDSEEAKTLINFLDGFAVQGTTARFLKVDSNNVDYLWLYKQNSAGNSIVTVFNGGTKPTLETTNTNADNTTGVFSYVGTKTLPTRYTFIDYVISDKEDAYPDGAEQGGFYYERFEPLNVDVFNCSKVATGEFTPASTSTQYSVTHGFGVRAKLSFVYDEASGDFLLTHYSRGGNYVPAPVYVYKLNDTYSQGYQNSSYGNNQNAIFYWGGNNFKAGTKYKYLIMA